MSQRKRTVINGVELPEDFDVTSRINNIAISTDGRYAAVTRAGDLVIAEIPESGKIEVDGTTITYKKCSGLGNINVSRCGIITSSISSSSVVISNGGSRISIGGGSDLEYPIDQGYDSISRLSLNAMEEDMYLGLSKDGKVYVRGLTSKEPELRDGRLIIERLEGKLLLPESRSDLEQDLKTMSGDIEGDVAHKGRMKTMSGDISIKLLAPLTIEVYTMSGDIDVRGMISDGPSRYLPPTGSLGDLYLETMSGDIDVRYEAK